MEQMFSGGGECGLLHVCALHLSDEKHESGLRGFQGLQSDRQGFQERGFSQQSIQDHRSGQHNFQILGDNRQVVQEQRSGRDGHQTGYGAPLPEVPPPGYGAPQPTEPPPTHHAEPIKIIKMTGLDDEEGPVDSFNYMYATENKSV